MADYLKGAEKGERGETKGGRREGNIQPVWGAWFRRAGLQDWCVHGEVDRGCCKRREATETVSKAPHTLLWTLVFVERAKILQTTLYGSSEKIPFGWCVCSRETFNSLNGASRQDSWACWLERKRKVG